MNFSSWLTSHGLGRLQAALTEAGIDIDILRDLGESDLREIGLRLGDRKRLLKAIAALESAPTSPSPEPAAGGGLAGPSAPAESSPVPDPGGERRQLTVMFCDLVGSTDLAIVLDPEDYRALLLRFHGAIAQSASGWSGQLAQLLGDGALVYFGHPVAHEDDAVRAVHAALDLVRLVGDLPIVPGTPGSPEGRMRVRVGVATGLVVLGEIGGGAVPIEISASGATPNLAARLQAVAEPGGIVIDERCRELLGGHFELAALEALTLKGYPGSMRAWKVLGARDAITRFALMRGASAASLIGRAAERGMLERHAARAIEGRGQALLLAGEAGLGKSRLCAAFIAQWQAGGGASLTMQASPYFTDTALHPVAVAMRRTMAVATRVDVGSAGPEDGRWRIPVGLAPDHAQRVGAWLDAQSGLSESSPMQSEQKMLLLDSLCAWVLALADDGPLAVLFEDVHWIDATTEEWIARLAARLSDRRLLLLLTARPEYGGQVLAAAGGSRLTLSRLDPDESAALVRAAARETEVEKAVAEAIMRRAEGNPLFLEELTRAVCAGVAHADASEVPATLGDSLTARLDRAPKHKPLVRMAAVVGREFSEVVLAAALGRPVSEVAVDMAELSATDLFVRGDGPGLWMFRHALLRDAAYSSLLRTRRAQAHSTVAQALAEVDPADAARRPELLAFHRQEAGETAAARELWMRAGDRSAREAAFREAATHYRAALRLIGHEQATPERDALELKLLMRLGALLAHREGFGSTAVLECFARARTLAERMNDPETFVAASAAVGGVLLAKGRPDEIEPLFHSLGAAQSAALSTRNRLARNSILAMATSQMGDQRSAWPLLVAACTGMLTEWPTAARTPGFLFAAVNLLIHAAFSALWQGRLQAADELTREALERTGETNADMVSAFALGGRAMVLIDLGRSDEARGLAQRALEISQAQGLEGHMILASLALGLIAVDQGRVDEGLARYRAHLDDWVHGQGVYHCGEFCGQMAKRLLHADRPGEAQALVHHGEKVLQGLAERVYAAELLRLSGRLRELEGDWFMAERQYQEAIELAARQGASRLELRAAASLAGLWLAQGQPARVRGLLDPLLEVSLMPRMHPEWIDAHALSERAQGLDSPGSRRL